MIQQLVRRGLATSSRQGLKAAAPSMLATSSRASAIPARVITSTPSRRQLHLSSSRLAQSTTPNSSLSNPAEEEAQKALDEGTTKLEAGDWEAAKEAYARSLTVHPSSTAHFNLGVVHFRLQDLPAAIKSFEASLALSKEQKNSPSSKSTTTNSSSDDSGPSSSDAESEFQSLGDADAHTNLASCYILSTPPRPDLAVQHLQSAVSLSPTDGESWFNLGAVLEACERLEESVKAYEKAQGLGVERAEENLRNVGGKILAARLGVGSGAVPQEVEEEPEEEVKEDGKTK